MTSSVNVGLMSGLSFQQASKHDASSSNVFLLFVSLFSLYSPNFFAI